MAAARRFPWNYVPHYVGAQLVGAVLAALATWGTFGGAGARTEANLAATYPAQGVGDLQAFLVEILITFILGFVGMAGGPDGGSPNAQSSTTGGVAVAGWAFLFGAGV